MLNSPRHHILVVDDERNIRDAMKMLLTASGYDVSTAEHGFDALLQLKTLNPAVIISDLNMPQMSGFEFLSIVRRRFPEIPVIAVSGAYESGDLVPGGVIADAFYAKGRHRPEELLRAVGELIRTSKLRAVNHHQQSAPVWIPRNGKDSKGVPHRADLHAMLALFSPERIARRTAGNPRDSLHVLHQPSPVHYRFLYLRAFSKDELGLGRVCPEILGGASRRQPTVSAYVWYLSRSFGCSQNVA
jgi:CheY-like chemotaxis protein